MQSRDDAQMRSMTTFLMVLAAVIAFKSMASGQWNFVLHYNDHRTAPPPATMTADDGDDTDESNAEALSHDLDGGCTNHDIEQARESNETCQQALDDLRTAIDNCEELCRNGSGAMCFDDSLRDGRHVIWHVLNGDPLGDRTLSAEADLGRVLANIIGGETVETRAIGLTTFMDKTLLFLDDDSVNDVARALKEGTPEARRDALKVLILSERRALDLLDSALSDDTRIDAYIRGEVVPPE
jgi:hypothetical protein